MSFRNGLLIGLGMLLAVVGAVLGLRVRFDRNAVAVADTRDLAASTALRDPFSHDFSQLADRVGKSIVNISSERDDTRPFRNPLSDFFERHNPFELDDNAREAKRISLGSGFIVSSYGYILTNSHVVENASRISVRLNDKRIAAAVVVGTDPKTDLAVLKIGNRNLPPLSLAQTDDVAVGDWVAAFGGSFGLEQTMTAGIISAKGRAIGSNSFNLLQTDAAINSENSGGPLVNMRGEVVGVNTTISDRGRGFKGIGFAIHAATARQVYEQLVRSGKVTRGWIGIRIQDVTPEIARSFELNRPGGALIADVSPNGPAAGAGIRSGDIILEFNHQQIQTTHDLLSAVADTKVGSSAPVNLLRVRKELSLNVTVGERPSAVAELFRSPEGNEPVKLGITVENVTPEVQAEMHLASNQGVLVIEVTPGSPADSGGVLPGDVIHSMNHAPVNRAADLLAAIGNLREDSTVLLMLERHGQLMYLAFQLSS